MMKKYFIIPLVFSLSSCATLLHQRTVDIQIHSDSDSTKICINNDTTRWYQTPTRINVERSKKNLWITARKDTLQKQIELRSKLSAAFLVGNMFSGIGIFGYVIDLTNPRRFTYPNYLTLDFKPKVSTKMYRPWLSPEKNLLNLKLSIPEGNLLYLNKGNGYGSSFGFLGLSGGFEYYLSDKYCISSNFGVLTDFMLPFPAPIDYADSSSHQSSSAVYGTIQIGSDLKNRWHYDLGLQFTRTLHYERECVELFPHYIDTLKYSKQQNNAGLAFSTYFRISNSFNLGINYFPSFLAWNNSRLQFHYSHLLFFELLFKVETFRPKRFRK